MSNIEILYWLSFFVPGEADRDVGEDSVPYSKARLSGELVSWEAFKYLVEYGWLRFFLDDDTEDMVYELSWKAICLVEAVRGIEVTADYSLKYNYERAKLRE